MMRKTISLLLLFCCGTLWADGRSDNEVKRACITSLARFMQYASAIYQENGTNANGEAIGFFSANSAGKSNEDGVRTNADLAMVSAFVALHGEEWNVSLPNGLTRDDLQRMSLSAFRFAVGTHRANQWLACTDGQHWGSAVGHHQWESSLWAMSVAFAGKLLDEQALLTVHDKEGLRHLLVSEADFELSRKVPTGFKGDTKAEENGWEANVLACALALMPAHDHAAQWEEAMNRFGFNCYTVDADANDETRLEGKMAKEWYEGTNLYPDFTLQNHDYFHTSYQNVVMQEQAESLLATWLLGNKKLNLRRTLTWHWQEVWDKVLVELALVDGELAMPNGNDWSMFLYDQLPAYAAMATLMQNSDARMLEMRCLDQLLLRQQTTNDGSYMLNADIGPRRMGVTAHRVMMTYLLHDLGLKEVKAAEWDDFVARYSQAKVLKHQNIVRGMSKDRFTCLSWSTGLRNCTGIIVPNTLQHCKIMIPYKEGCGGNLMGRITNIPPQWNVNVRGGEWTVRGSVDGKPYAIFSTAGNAVVVIGRPLFMAISMDPFTCETRNLQQGTGWANIDDAVGFVSNQTVTLSAPKTVNSIGTAILEGTTDSEVPVSIYFCNVTAKQTEKLAKKTRISHNGNQITVETQDPDGKKIKVEMLTNE